MSTSDQAPTLRSYRLIAEIGRGGMANVYLAVARGPAGFNKLVVIKKTRTDLSLDSDVLSMFLDEARIAARMNHPNVVQTYEFGEDEGRHFIAMEYLDGQPYSRILARMKQGVPLPMHVRVVADLLAGLHHAHELRDFDGTPLDVIHRDATPQNVFVTYDGSIKVVDFGIAKALDSVARTRAGVVKGKVAYMAPEQVRGDPLDRRADIFAVGVMLWEAMAGHRMWDELPELTVVHELMFDRVPSIAAAAPGAPRRLLEICDRALAPRRDERYATALEMNRDLEDYLGRCGERATARDVGELIAPAFAKDRKRVRTVIESQLRDVRWTGQMLPAIHMSAPLTGMPAPVQPTPVSRAEPWASVAGSGQGSFVPTNAGAALPMPPPPAARSRSLLVPALVAALVSIGVVALGVKLLVLPAVSSAPAASATVAAAPTATATATAEVPAMVKLAVRVKPAEAKVTLDGVLLSEGPFEGEVRRADKPSALRVQAEGYLPKEEEIVLTGDLVVSFDLEKAKRGPLRGPGGGRPSKPKHDIDSDSPYKR